MNAGVIAAMMFNMQQASKRNRPREIASPEMQEQNQKAIDEIEKIHREKGLYSALQALQPKIEKQRRQLEKQRRRTETAELLAIGLLIAALFCLLMFS